jgi:hypothetical protein
MKRHNIANAFFCPYKDEGCQYYGTQMIHLDGHINKVHLKAKPYACHHPGCAYSTNAQPNLCTHLKTKHGEGKGSRKPVLRKNPLELEDLPIPTGMASESTEDERFLERSPFVLQDFLMGAQGEVMIEGELNVNKDFLLS